MTIWKAKFTGEKPSVESLVQAKAFLPVDQKGKTTGIFWRGVAFFFLLWVVIAAAVFSFLYFIHTTPEGFNDFLAGISVSLTKTKSQERPLPLFEKNSAVLVIESISVEAPIVFANTTDRNALKLVLDTGVVHYVESSLPGEGGNVFLFGHSSKKIFEPNPWRTVFTHLSEVKFGDTILIRSAGVEYRYRVTSIETLKPDQARVYFQSVTPKLTLSTCWPVGDPANRTVVEAEFVGKSAISQAS